MFWRDVMMFLDDSLRITVLMSNGLKYSLLNTELETNLYRKIEKQIESKINGSTSGKGVSKNI